MWSNVKNTSLSSPELPKGERNRHIKDDLNPFRQEGCRLNPAPIAGVDFSETWLEHQFVVIFFAT